MTQEEFDEMWFGTRYIEEGANHIELLIKLYGKEVLYEMAYGLPRLERETIEIKELP